MNVSYRTVLVSVLLSASLVFACGGSEGTTTDSNGTDSSRRSRGSDDDSDSRDEDSRDSDDRDDGTSSQQQDDPPQTQECRGSSICINGSCKCESGPQKGKSCCYAPEEEDDPPCAKANECDNVCNSCD